MKLEVFGIRIGSSKKGKTVERVPPPVVEEKPESPPTLDILKRVSNLSPEYYATYERLNNIRQELGPTFRRLPEEEKARWRQFSLAFLETPEDFSLARYALKPETFPSDRFALKAVAAEHSSPFQLHREYGDRGNSVTGPFESRHVFIDAPFAYLLLYKKDDGTWETISTAAFILDAKKNVLLIDQLQGGNTSRYKTSDEARRVRMKFATKPEEILYEAVRDLAKRSNVRGVGLRKAEKNEWKTVKDAAKEKRTPYDHIAESKGLKGFASEHYFLEPIEVTEAKEQDP